MEPVTHILTGACLSRSGLNRRAAYATLAMAVSAELPDIDTLWSLRGPIAGFEHHRGITHTFLGVPFEAAAVVGGIYLLHRWRLSRHSPSSRRPVAAAPVRWGLLYLFSLLALLSHLLLDYTNNYGIRPFFPFNPHWYAASIVFIFDPLIFALLLGALLLPSLFRLVSAEVGARRQAFASPGWAVAALLSILAIWTFREVQHNHAIDMAMAQSLAAPQPAASQPDAPQPAATTPPAVDNSADAPPPPDPTPTYLPAQRALASPDPFSPFRWYAVTDFGPLYQLSVADTRTATLVPNQAMQPKPDPSPALLAAQQSWLGRVYLDWSPMPFITITRSDPGQPNPQTTVRFADPRFMGDTPLLHFSGKPPLTGTVLLDAANHVLRQSLDGKVQPRR